MAGATVLSLLLFAAAAAGASLTPDRNITIVNTETEEPAWKLRWDEARELARQERNSEAIERYLEVLEEKPHIEAVKWELFQNYLALDEYTNALPIIEGLLEAAPGHLVYLTSAGEAALGLGRTELAQRYFGQALELDPVGPSSEAALQGMIRALRESGKTELTIPLMEQLYRRGSITPDLLVNLARATVQHRGRETAAAYYLELATKYRLSPELVREAADALERSGMLEEAARQWAVYLASRPDDVAFRRKLAAYHQERGNPEQALEHMLYLLDLGIGAREYLLKVADIYLYELGRTDRALAYLKRYQQEFPDGIDVSPAIADLELIMANDLLAIVENDGSWLLWRDLAAVTPDRVGIYRAMAGMLEKMGPAREKNLLEVLQIINLHDPDDLDTVLKVAELMAGNDMFDECLAFLARVGDRAGRDPRVLLSKAACEAGAGNELAQLSSYVDYLELEPDDETVRTSAVELAGTLGLVEQMDELYRNTNTASSAEGQTSSLARAYVLGLLRNRLAELAEDLLDTVPAASSNLDDSPLLVGELAAVYTEQQRVFRAEQILRLHAARNPGSIDSYLLLAGHALQRRDEDSAARYLGLVEKKSGTWKTAPNENQLSSLRRYRFDLDILSGSQTVYDEMRSYLDRGLNQKTIVAADVDILATLARYYIRQGRHDEAVMLLQRFKPTFKRVDEVTALQFIGQALSEEALEKGSAAWADQPSSLQFALADQLIRLERYERARALLAGLVETMPDSVYARLMLGRAHDGLAHYDRAYRQYAEINALVPGETYFLLKKIRIEQLHLDTEPASIYEQFSLTVDASGEDKRIVSRAPIRYPEALLMWARTLWTDGRQEEALNVYELIEAGLSNDIEALLRRIGESRIFARFRSEPLPGAMFFKPDDDQILEYLMSTDFFVSDPGNEINEITAQYYERYTWRRITAKEIAARRSLIEKEFYQAEIEYEELFREEGEVAAEVYPDLATVYGRLGRFEKETELLERIKEQDIVSAELEQAAEKNLRRRQPHVSLEGSYLEEDGRDGFKDIARTFTGLGLQIMPTSFQEAGLLAGRVEYGNSGASALTKSNYLLGRYGVYFSDTLSSSLSLGFEDLDTEGDIFEMFDLSVTGTLEERVEIFATLRQEPVYDTIESIEEGIYSTALQAGLTLDYLFGFFFGFDVSFIDYSDDNEERQYHLWSSYRWFGDRSSLDFTYDYLYRQNELTNELPPAGKSETADIITAYWSPENYWIHQLSAEYKLELWPTGPLQSGTSFLSAAYALGYEAGDNFVHDVEINILLELSKSFLVKGTFSTVRSEDYDSLYGFASLVYRW